MEFFFKVTAKHGGIMRIVVTADNDVKAWDRVHRVVERQYARLCLDWDTRSIELEY